MRAMILLLVGAGLVGCGQPSPPPTPQAPNDAPVAVAIDKPEPVSVRPVVATKEPSIVEKVRVDLFHIGWTEQTDGPYLALFWYAQAEEGARYEYLGGWEGLHFVCRDDTGRIYPPQMVPRHPARTNRPQAVAEKIAALSAAAKARGQGFNVNPSNGLVTHNSIILDGIVIEKPAEQAQKLTVIFRGAALGVRGDFVFEIPQELWDNSIK